METYFASKIDGLLITASWSQELRGQLGLTGASQVWGERPAWYVWLANSPGAYQLELVEAGPVGAGSQADLRRAVLAVRHYPSPDSAAFRLFSPRERALIRGPLFDHTGAPTFEGRAGIAPELFMVGALEFLCQAGADWMLFCLSALTECRETTATGPVRRAPGWNLSLPIVSALLSLWAFQSRQTPLRVQLTSEAGFEQRPGGAAAATQDIRMLSLAALFCPDPANPPAEVMVHLDDQAGEPGRTLLEDETYRCCHFHPPRDPTTVSALCAQCWRFAQAQYQSDLTSTCGCGH